MKPSFSNCWVLCCQNFSLDWCKQPDVGLPKPDLVVFLQLRLVEAARRGEFGRERYENGNFQERALHRFHQLMADETLNWKVRVSSCVSRTADWAGWGPLAGDSETAAKRCSFCRSVRQGLWARLCVRRILFLCDCAKQGSLVPCGGVGENWPDSSSRQQSCAASCPPPGFAVLVI